MKKSYGLRLYIILTAAVMLLIFIQSALPADISSKESAFIVRAVAELLNIKAKTLTVVIRKAAHFTEFAVLGLCLIYMVRAYIHKKKDSLHVPFIILILCWAAGALYGVSDEFHQLFVSGRSCELRDMLIDAGGTAAGIIIGRLLQRRKRPET